MSRGALGVPTRTASVEVIIWRSLPAHEGPDAGCRWQFAVECARSSSVRVSGIAQPITNEAEC
ncbi:MAG: hypothetical protein EBT00_14470, partial [Proteobacteria bacterium]|nr:hypothetical protein [Pseudomonadota bacterium]